MRLSTKGRFAVTAMIDVGLRQHTGPVSLSDIAARHQISMSYLEQLFSKLRHSGLVESTRGPSGGYALTRAASAISVADIIGAVETEGPEAQARAQALSAQDSCALMTVELWVALQAKLLAHMQSISLHSLVEEQRSRGGLAEAATPQRGIYKRPETKPQASAPNSVFALGRLALAGR
jgi:Rrf2 family iron-sulfur cluster assembly transcriptional regulator